MQPRFLSAQLHFALKAQLAKCRQRQAGGWREERNKVPEFRDAMQRQHKGWMERSLKGNVRMFLDFSVGVDFWGGLFCSLSSITWAIFQYSLDATLLIYFYYFDTVCFRRRMFDCIAVIHVKSRLARLRNCRKIWDWDVTCKCTKCFSKNHLMRA